MVTTDSIEDKALPIQPAAGPEQELNGPEPEPESEEEVNEDHPDSHDD